jgi:hypothetical protein
MDTNDIQLNDITIDITINSNVNTNNTNNGHEHAHVDGHVSSGNGTGEELTTPTLLGPLSLPLIFHESSRTMDTLLSNATITSSAPPTPTLSHYHPSANATPAPSPIIVPSSQSDQHQQEDPSSSSCPNNGAPVTRYHSGSMTTRLGSSSFSSSPRNTNQITIGIVGGQRPIGMSLSSASSTSSHDSSHGHGHPCYINRLNGDALLHIMRFIDVNTLACSVTRVSRYWYRLSSHDVLWTEFVLVRWPELGQAPAAEPHPSAVDPFETVETRRKSRAASLSNHLLADAQPSLLSLLLQHYIRLDRSGSTTSTVTAPAAATYGYSNSNGAGAGTGHMTNVNSVTGTYRSSMSMNKKRIVEENDSCICTSCSGSGSWWNCCCDHHNPRNGNNGTNQSNNGVASVTVTPTRGSGNNGIRTGGIGGSGYRNARWWYSRWITGRDIFGPSRIAYDYEFRPQVGVDLQLDKGRHFIIEGIDWHHY